MKTAVIIPTYNEAENLEILVEKILESASTRGDSSTRGGLKLIVVDDNSPDGTGKIADKLSLKYKNKIIVIHREGKIGLGTAYKEGFKKAIKTGADVFVTMDADLSHNPLVIPKLINLLKYCDVAIGSRYVVDGQIIGFNVWRKILSGVAQLLSRSLLGIKVKDSTSAYRAYKKNVINSIDLENIKSDGYSFLIEVIYRCLRKDYKVKEIPITFGLREGGVSKISKKEIYKSLVTIFRLKLTSLFS
ncbi:hypothetical protein A3D00_03075 [Candidatus Woesebacteria bacterium RIFCSPHIGHO2_02_FULL_38_9]|uniref:Glycosyltransferase 2-like domain-containing protein n=1 Tax=Candidatus Woesebacteria bacterium RIFCSPHIGHO2_01_FULL_39_28 TaxID=1802496 RepID=A0A1F7YEU9_9BACT|nr:MAG: hypothetical protein A2627_02805 [Candidatus Woesebacteria bacterium RIFCSPHIGHO2_01_FULL_39_28]OGM34668.1 MAG: hypothetical protein A3D00_03075 [Candidatus Woesebacteria bacterium RIFCSPHIGHO2_02_FULL_38_9]OGM58596.1 MAG: hypothetical protein A3A50_00945 [Candidatus Woesebacteria bacterium RIFCSPLOWO2_01_FULL_38_20]